MDDFRKALDAQERARREAMREFVKPFEMPKSCSEAAELFRLELQKRTLSLAKTIAEYAERNRKASESTHLASIAFRRTLESIRFTALPDIDKKSEPAELTPKKRIGFRFED